jgi:hypothetical protein
MVCEAFQILLIIFENILDIDIYYKDFVSLLNGSNFHTPGQNQISRFSIYNCL